MIANDTVNCAYLHQVSAHTVHDSVDRPLSGYKPLPQQNSETCGASRSARPPTDETKTIFK